MSCRRFSFLLTLAVLPLVPGTLARSEDRPLYRDPAQPVEARVRDLVSRLTLEEKGSLMRNGAAGVPRLGIPQYDWWNEALHGVARAGEATVFPQAIGLAAMWDVDFMQTVADTVSTEARAKYHEAIRHDRHDRFYGLTFWTPNINIFRDPRWGRGQETYGEDPYLTARLGVAFVRGLQGDDPRYLKTAACAKHFAVHSGPESLRHGFDVAPDEADFHDTYLPAFEALVREARVETVMTAYNSLYGQPCALNDRLYDLLYRRWGFNGHVVSDCGAIADLYTSYHIAHDPAEAEALAIKSGLCLRCGAEKPAIAEAVRRGLITSPEVDLRLSQLLRTMFRLGFFDPPESVPYARIPFSENNSPAHAALALEAARKSIVLLKNDGTLPLHREALHRVAVIGPGANSVPVLLGNYNGTPSAPVTLLAGLQAALGPGVTVDYVRGCDYVAARPGLLAIPRTALQSGEYTGLEGKYFPNPGLQGAPVAERRDRPVEFTWDHSSLPAGVPADNFSVRWTGQLVTSAAGEYQLTVAGNGGFRLFLGEQAVIDAWSPGEKSRTVLRHFAENDVTPVRLEYYQSGGPGSVALKWTVPDAREGLAAALAAARAADAVIFAGGISAQLEGEEMRVDFDGFQGGDRTRIELPEVQGQFLRELQATGKPVVLVLLSGSALAVPWAEAHLNAIVEAWYPGQAGGTAVADVLLGNTNPAGRLPVTFYRATADLPVFEDYHMANRTYRYFAGQPLYPFGYGLSYTRFRYDHLKVSPVMADMGGRLQVTVDVTNNGDRDGDEVVQLYAQEPGATAPRARESLCGFRRIHLVRGVTREVKFIVTDRELRRWSTGKNAYVIPTGEWRLLAGASSADIRQSAAARVE